jgi:hypothetical protein
MPKFVKLGEHASVFSDPTSGLLVIGDEVHQLETKHERSKKVKVAIQGGHLVHATEDEFKRFTKGEKVVAKKEPVKNEKSIDEMDLTELQEWVVKESGWDKADKKKVVDIKTVEELLPLVKKINEDYE